METQKKRVIIIGGGFGGTYTARHLLPLAHKGFIEITLINQTNYFLFTPLLHEVATGGLSPTNIAEPLREAFDHNVVTFIKARADSINSTKKIVNCGTHSYPYDYLVCAVGADTNFYGIPGAKEHSFTLKNLEEAMEIRYRIIELFEEASLITDATERRLKLSFVIVGGGATGVEFAAELAEFSCRTMLAVYGGKSVFREDISITLVTSDPELILQFHPKLRTKAAEILKRKGVKVLFNKVVSNVEAEKVIFKNGEDLTAGTIIWLAGVTPVFPDLNNTLSLHPSKRLAVDEYLRAPNVENVFVLGDAAAVQTSSTDSRPLPMLAQVAVVEARTVAKNIEASIHKTPLKPFTYQSLGSLISVGQWMALGDIFGMRVSGPHIWWLWRTVYLFKFHSWRKRFKIAFEWTINLFYPRDITKVL